MLSHEEQIIPKGHPTLPLIINAPSHYSSWHLHGHHSVSASTWTCTYFASEPECQGFHIYLVLGRIVTHDGEGQPVSLRPVSKIHLRESDGARELKSAVIDDTRMHFEELWLFQRVWEEELLVVQIAQWKADPLVLLLKERGDVMEAVLREELRRKIGVKVDHNMLRERVSNDFLKSRY